MKEIKMSESLKKWQVIEFANDNSTTFIRMKNGKHEYYAYAHLNPEDRYSKIVGGTICEHRCYLKYWKDKLKEKKKQYKIINDFLKRCIQTEAFDRRSLTAKVVFHQLNLLNKEIVNITNEIDKEKIIIQNAGKLSSKYQEYEKRQEQRKTLRERIRTKLKNK
jgi:hypothetical protein